MAAADRCRPGGDRHAAQATHDAAHGELNLIGALLQSAGALLAIGATVHLGGSFGVTAANRGVITSGPYKAVRHPIYAAYLLICLGVVMCAPSWSNSAVLLMWVVVQV